MNVCFNNGRCKCFCMVFALAVLLLASDRSWAISVRHDKPIASYNALAEQFPATGYIATAGTGHAHRYCTGTLVAPNKVLTAAHCVDPNGDGTIDRGPGSLVFGLEPYVPIGPLANNVSSIAIHPDWGGSGMDEQFDLAVLTLTTPITDVAPAKIYGGNPAGMTGYLVGYGVQGTGTNSLGGIPGANQKLAAENTIDRVDVDTLRYDFDNPNGTTGNYGSSTPLDLEGTTAAGDSGGPLYVQMGDEYAIVGVLSGGTTNTSNYGDDSIYAPLSSRASDSGQNVGLSHIDWLAAQGVPQSVPEPSTSILLVGMMVTVVLRRRRV